MGADDVTKDVALHEFFCGFGLDAYERSSVPGDVKMPYLTYEGVIGSWGSGTAYPTVQIWYKTESNAVPNAKAEEIDNRIGLGGVQIPCDSGVIWIRRGDKWIFAAHEADQTVKLRQCSMAVDFLCD